MSHAEVLQNVHDELVKHPSVAVAIGNYRDISSGLVYRMTTTGVLGAGSAIAVSTFRRYSFMSGVVLDGRGARRESTDTCDGSEMYQMYLGARLVGVGGQLLSLDSIHVDRFPGCKAAGWPLARRRPRRIRIVTAQPSSASSLEALMIGGYCPALAKESYRGVDRCQEMGLSPQPRTAKISSPCPWAKHVADSDLAVGLAQG
jgi:hypothetical protein